MSVNRFGWDDDDLVRLAHRTIQVTQSCGHTTTWELDDQSDEVSFRTLMETSPCGRCIERQMEREFDEYRDSER